jgi:hypothetical protein
MLCVTENSEGAFADTGQDDSSSQAEINIDHPYWLIKYKTATTGTVDYGVVPG